MISVRNFTCRLRAWNSFARIYIDAADPCFPSDFHILTNTNTNSQFQTFSYYTMSVASKVKLPSIAELTNPQRLPKQQVDSSPLLLIFRTPVPPARHQVLLPEQQEYHPTFPPVANVMPYYLYVPQQHNVYLHQYYPVYYNQQQHPHQHHPNGPAAQPQNYSHQPYSVAEVINKPMNKCHRCGTTETPEWRRGPNGLRTLCNACGLFHAKLVKRKGAVLAAEEVLNNKVCKGKNGRRVLIKKQAMDELKKRMREAQVTEIPPIPYGPRQEYSYLEVHTPSSAAAMPPWAPRVALPPPVVSSSYQTLPPLKN